MKLNARALAFTAAIFWGGLVFLVACGNQMWGYGETFCMLMDSLYPGYHYGSWGSVFVGTGYAVMDGLVAGWVFGWLHNRFS